MNNRKETFNRPKATELLSYLIQKLGDQATIQKVMLAAFESDMTSYRDHGCSITGAAYTAVADGVDSADLREVLKEICVAP